MDEQAKLELVLEVRDAIARIEEVRSRYDAAIKNMAAATKAGLDPASKEYQHLLSKVKETGGELLEVGQHARVAMGQLATATGKGTEEVKNLDAGLATVRADIDRVSKEGVAGVGGLTKGFNALRVAVVAVVGAFLTIQIKDFIRGSVGAAEEAEDALGRVRAAVEATEQAAGRSVEQIVEISKRVQAETTFGDEQILDLANTLLTFDKIHGQTFDRAINAIVDYSAKSRREVNDIGLAVGKSLQIPGEALVSLQRAGIIFSDSQKKVIEELTQTGQAAAAQGLILSELERRAGGAAKALNDELGGALKNLRDQWQEVQEAFGKGLGEELAGTFEGFSVKAQEAEQKASSFGRGLGILVNALLSVGGALQDAGAAFGRFIAGLRGLDEASTRTTEDTLKHLDGAMRDTGVSAGRMATLFTESFTDIQTAGGLTKDVAAQLLGIANVIAHRLLAEGKELPAFLLQAMDRLRDFGEAAAAAAPSVEGLAGGVRQLTDDQKKLAESLGLTGEHLAKQVTDLLAVIAETKTHGKVTTEEKEIIKKALAELLTSYQTIGEQAPAELKKVAAEFGALSKQQEAAAQKLKDFVKQAYADLAERNKAMTDAAQPNQGEDEGAKMKARIEELEESVFLTIEQANELDTLKNKLGDFNRAAANDFSKINEEMGRTGDTAELTAAEIVELGDKMDGTAGSLGRLHPEFERLDANVRRAGTAVDRQNESVSESVQVFDRLGNEIAAYEVGSKSAGDAVAGLAANQAEFNNTVTASAEAAVAAADGTAALGDEAKTTEEKVAELAKEMKELRDAFTDTFGEEQLKRVDALADKLEQRLIPLAIQLKECLDSIEAAA